MNPKTPPFRQEVTDASSASILGVTRARLHLMSFAMLGVAFSIYLINVWRHSTQLWDDAFISFRFAEHLAGGHGLCWNIGGERVEGFTSMLHVLLLAGGAKLGIPLETTSLIIGVAGAAGTAVLLVLILRACFGLVYPLAAFFPAAYLVDWTTTVHSTSGLETQLFVLLLCAALGCALLFADRATYWRATGLGFCLFLAVLCRPDGVLYGTGLLVVLGGYSLFSGGRGPQPAKTVLPFCFAVLVLLAFSLSYVVWKHNYFGYLFPNPFYLKSNEISTHGLVHTRRYLVHAAKWLAPPLAAALVLVPMRTLRSALASAHVRRAAMLALVPPVLALAYYATIIHEVGGAHRFGYPTYSYFVLAAAALATLCVESARDRRLRNLLFGVPAAGSVVLLVVAVTQLMPLKKLSEPAIGAYHRKIGVALRATGIGRDGTVICIAAGVLPRVSGFNHVDPVGLTDNFLSGRVPRSLRERDAYIWDQDADVYIGPEPPAGPGSSGPQDDRAMRSPYVREHLVKRKPSAIEARFRASEPVRLYARMVELRDRWDLVGEIGWPGWRYWKLRSFVYVRKQSPFRETLVSALAGIVDVEPAEIDLAHPPDYP